MIKNEEQNNAIVDYGNAISDTLQKIRNDEKLTDQMKLKIGMPLAKALNECTIMCYEYQVNKQ